MSEENPTETPADVPTLGAGRYRCRPHYRPVSWRGTGCPECDADMVRPLRRRRLAAPEAEGDPRWVLQ
ncbi:hypothetical protein BJ986_000209 [Phycicoccus badiiscoriae]|uniref:Uncharacterized protein n=1 Tax=Pedococcus badiiscoriae TaxID=642776 RepID=A0A852WK99_9MICO|nr:hypothetical protein [Pedococcus badiiscoriae]